MVCFVLFSFMFKKLKHVGKLAKDIGVAACLLFFERTVCVCASVFFKVSPSLSKGVD